MLVYFILIYFLIKLVFGTDKIDDFFLSFVKSLFYKKHLSFAPAENFNTPALRVKWWNDLDEQWRMVFRFQVYPNIDFNGLDIADYVLNAKQLEVNLNGISNLNGLIHLSNLTDLQISNYNSTDLSVLKRLIKLTKLEITNSNFSKIVPVGAISNIVNLKLENCQIIDLSYFISLKNLKQLNLKNNFIKDISCVKCITHLEFLALQNNPISDFSYLKYLPNTTIELSYNQKFNLRQLQDNNIQVIITFNLNYHQYDETFFQNN